jgi:hypothetical protein
VGVLCETRGLAGLNLLLSRSAPRRCLCVASLGRIVVVVFHVCWPCSCNVPGGRGVAGEFVTQRAALLASSTALEALLLASLTALDASLTAYSWFVTLDASLTLLGITLPKLSFALAEFSEVSICSSAQSAAPSSESGESNGCHGGSDVDLLAVQGREWRGGAGVKASRG